MQVAACGKPTDHGCIRAPGKYNTLATVRILDWDVGRQPTPTDEEARNPYRSFQRSACFLPLQNFSTQAQPVYIVGNKYFQSNSKTSANLLSSWQSPPFPVAAARHLKPREGYCCLFCISLLLRHALFGIHRGRLQEQEGQYSTRSQH